MVVFVSLERVDVKYGVLPGEICALQCVLDRVSLRIIGGDDFETSLLFDVTLDYLDYSLNFPFVLRSGYAFGISIGLAPRRVMRTIQLFPSFVSSPLLTSTKRQQTWVLTMCTVSSLEL